MSGKRNLYTQWPSHTWLSNAQERNSLRRKLWLMHSIAWPSYALGALLLVEFFYKG